MQFCFINHSAYFRNHYKLSQVKWAENEEIWITDLENTSAEYSSSLFSWINDIKLLWLQTVDGTENENEIQSLTQKIKADDLKFCSILGTQTYGKVMKQHLICSAVAGCGSKKITADVITSAITSVVTGRLSSLCYFPLSHDHRVYKYSYHRTEGTME